MGLFDDILETLTTSGATPTRKKGAKSAISSIFSGAAFGGSIEDIIGEQAAPAGEEGEEVDPFAGLLDASFQMQKEELAEAFTKARTPEDFLNARQGALEFASLLENRDALVELATSTFNLEGAFTGEDDTEASIARIAEFTSAAETILTSEGAEEEALSTEDEAFQDLLRRGTELDVLLKEQQLVEAQRQQEFAGVLNLLDVLPAKQRADTVAALLDTDVGQALFFGGQQQGATPASAGGAPLPSGPTPTATPTPGPRSLGQEFLSSFRGGK